MSAPVVLRGRGGVGLRRLVVPWLVVRVAVIVARWSPARIRRVLTRVSAGARPATVEQARWARERVVAASARCAGEGCLPRSIATALLCRLRGTWPTWCCGVRVQPFLAHAWVEVDGAPVDEPYPAGYHHALIRVG
ncbi:lasso peptide biosynthesis B2 protein [Actinokineospora iranica]|uniref:Transglutaminase-like superfamily protein n=1 Tax=Actinokineospora iranica TaxID=1271860 RepID=A0A1G6U4Q4_9PSEU|nr:lasso peptide biosynthesis B2 protein [Actinokineospora iranica]SDD36273.1 Transglutaminase-like superfamily protein [Actinokineospora iranica]